jgi:hypothetical protein
MSIRKWWLGSPKTLWMDSWFTVSFVVFHVMSVDFVFFFKFVYIHLQEQLSTFVEPSALSVTQVNTATHRMCGSK